MQWFALEAGEYAALAPDAGGVLRSRVFPGLWLDSRSLLKGDAAGMLAVLRQGLATPEHAAFVSSLAVAKPRA